MKINFTINVWIYFCALNFFSLICMSTFMPVPHSLDYSSFAISFEIAKCESTNLLSFLKKILAIFGPEKWNFYINFRISLWIFAKLPARNLIRIAGNLYIILGSIIILIILSLLNPWTLDDFAFSKFSLISFNNFVIFSVHVLHLFC